MIPSLKLVVLYRLLRCSFLTYIRNWHKLISFFGFCLHCNLWFDLHLWDRYIFIKPIGFSFQFPLSSPFHQTANGVDIILWFSTVNKLKSYEESWFHLWLFLVWQLFIVPFFCPFFFICLKRWQVSSFMYLGQISVSFDFYNIYQ